MEIAFWSEGARPVAGVVIGDSVIYRAALGDDADLSVRVFGTGVEDYAYFASKPSRAALSYGVDVSRTSGLRLIANVLEFLDFDGTPRLRMAAPTVVTASGNTLAGAVAVAGCAVDTDPRPPWGRLPTLPGASSCEVLITWDAEADAYPLVVDPAWSTAQVSPQGRSYFGVSPTATGRVLVAGGIGFFGQGFVDCIPTSELYDPASGTWAATGSKTDPCCVTMAPLPGGKLLCAAGTGTSQASRASAESFNPTTGTWSPAGQPVANDVRMSSALLDGRVLVLGAAVAQLYNPSLNSWTQAAAPTASHLSGTANRLPNGRVLVAGGIDAARSPVATAEIFDPQTGTWTPAAPMLAARGSHASVTLTSGKVLVAGGAGAAPSANGEVYDPASNSWTATGPHISLRGSPTANLLADGRVLLAGGWMGPALASSEVYDPESNRWLDAGPMVHPHAYHGAATLPDGRVLIIGGVGDQNSSGDDLFTPLSGGGACVADGQCKTGHCADGVCCDQDCRAACYACSAALKGAGPDGVCGAVAAQPEPHGLCPASTPTSCGTTGMCTGKGACEFFVAGFVCKAPACTSDGRLSAACDGRGACAEVVATCGAYACDTPTSCRTACTTDAECAKRFACDVASSTCFPRPPKCDGAHTLDNADGTTTECAPFACEGQVCKTACASGLDCAAVAACSRDAVCLPLSAAQTSGAGEGFCAVGWGRRSAAAGSGWLLLSVLTAVRLRSRRNRCRGAS